MGAVVPRQRRQDNEEIKAHAKLMRDKILREAPVAIHLLPRSMNSIVTSHSSTGNLSEQNNAPTSSRDSMTSLESPSFFFCHRGSGPTSLRKASFIKDELFRDAKVGHQMVETHGLKIALPGRVGCEDESVNVEGMEKGLLRTKRVHMNKARARQKYAKKALTSLEDVSREQVGEEAAEGERMGKDMPEDERQALLKVIQQHFIFGALEASEHSLLVDQLVELVCDKGHVLCSEGESGHACYIIRSGLCAVMVGNSQVAELSAGQTFGELAMLYDVPRNATVVCASPTVTVCRVGGVVFRSAMARAREKTLSERLAFLSDHDLFSKLTVDENIMLASCFVQEVYHRGEKVMSEECSKNAEWMYLIQEGKVEVMDQYRNRQVVGPGDLISGMKMHYGLKVVTATTLSDMRCLALGERVINRLFGNISELLRCASIRQNLMQVAFYRELSDKQQTIVAALFHEQKVRRGETVVTAMADPQLVLVFEGDVDVIDQGATPALAKVTPGEFSAVCVSENRTKRAPEPELERPAITGQNRTLTSGEVYGEDTFASGSCMDATLIAPGDAIVSRVGIDELCRHLRGYCHHTPTLQWILLRNRVKKRLQDVFPFSALYEDILDKILEEFDEVTFPAHARIVGNSGNATGDVAGAGVAIAPTASTGARENDLSRSFLLVVEGEAVVRRDGQLSEPLVLWSVIGVSQMFNGVPWEAEVTAAGSGCKCLALSAEKAQAAIGAFFTEFQKRLRARDLRLLLSDLDVECELGEGQFGVVRKVNVPALGGATFALKQINKLRAVQLDMQGSTKLEREILSECVHPLIVQLTCTFQDEANVYFLMETLEGGDLFTAIREIGQLSEEQLLFFTASIVLAIEYVHSRSIIYRDLKPENVMLTAQGHVKLIDFGCCTRKQRTYSLIGTYEYIAPEMIIGKGYTKAVDWWAIGVIAYEMFCGPLPFGDGLGEPLDIFKEILEKPLEIPSRTTPDLADLFQALLERRPEVRLGSSKLHERNEVQMHPFFNGLAWDSIESLSIVPPYVPCPQEPPADVAAKRSSIDSKVPTNRKGSLDSSGSTPVLPGQVDEHSVAFPSGTDLSCFDGF
eukprot:TRINITY_DN23179_c0_g1_i1.p1 TRINITY_DN23179_c0_g1~~TRINITY_DN23179_c0_g1_i1.p1  ORF type:complete len:1088 (-),score=282.46 TRINITY_DN23179_c0_g1_i1:83-3346(-)